MNTPLASQIKEICQKARASAQALALADAQTKNRAIAAVADSLQDHRAAIREANAKDVAGAVRDGLSPAMVDRLTLTDARIDAMAAGAREIVALHDPVGEILKDYTRPNGLRITKKRVPIGVIGIIYESRPNVTCDAAVLCLKTGNATVLRGGSEAIASNLAIAGAMGRALASAGLPAEAVQLIPTTDRAAITALCEMDAWVDLLIPRGGHGLIETVVKHARMPVIKHYHGICHVFVDKSADFAMAEKICVNAKCQRPGTCNAMETLLVDEAVAAKFLPALAATLRAHRVELRGCDACRAIVPDMLPATEEDWSTEYLDLVLSVRVVAGLDAAIAHIERYGSRHSDAIVTGDARAAEVFLNSVDSAAVYWNASTRFTDGGEFGFGAEIGVSTDKIHARGPMGLEELTSYKYQVIGEGHARA